MKMIYAHRFLKYLVTSFVALVFTTSLVAQEADSLFELPSLDIDIIVVDSVAKDTASDSAIKVKDTVNVSTIVEGKDTIDTAKTVQRMYVDTVVEKIQISSEPIESTDNTMKATETKTGAAMPLMLQHSETLSSKPTISKIASEVPQDTAAMKTPPVSIKVVTTEEMAAQGQQPPLDADIAAREAEKKNAEAEAAKEVEKKSVVETVAPKEKQATTTPAKKEVVTTASSKAKPKTQVASSTSSSTSKKTTAEAGIVYRVQVLALQNESQQALNEIKKQVGAKIPVSVIPENGMQKYVAGSFKTYNEAAQFKNELVEKGCKGCFVVAYSNGKRVGL